MFGEFFQICSHVLGLNCVPQIQNLYVEALTPTTVDWECIWK